VKRQQKSKKGRRESATDFVSIVLGSANSKEDTPELKQVVARVENELGAGRQAVWSLGAIWWDLKHRKLAEAGGFDSPELWWLERLGPQVDLKAIQRCGRLKLAFSEQSVLNYNTDCLDRYITLCRKMKREILKDPGNDIISFIDRGDTVQKPFAKCTEREMKAALHALVPKKDPGVGVPDQLAKFINYAETNLDGAEDDEHLKLEAYMFGTEARIKMDFSVFIFVEALKSLIKSTQGFKVFTDDEPE
jgi:hypothetical protein